MRLVLTRAKMAGGRKKRNRNGPGYRIGDPGGAAS
jgi:hypothetical protein